MSSDTAQDILSVLEIRDGSAHCPVQLQSVASGFTRTCPVCSDGTSTDVCLMLRQWLLPAPSLSIDKSALVHEECLDAFMDALDGVWQHTGAGIAASL